MKKICTIVFLTLLSVLFVGSLVLLGHPIMDLITGYGGGIRGILLTAKDTSALESALNEHIPAHNQWIQCYGGFLRTTGTDVVLEPDSTRSVYRLQNGSVTFLVQKSEPFGSDTISQIQMLSEAADRVQARKWFISIPQKICSSGTAPAARGVHDYAEEIDAYRCAFFKHNGYSVLDLHEAIHSQKLDHDSLYFRTDHHWTAQAGLWAAREMAASFGIDTAPLNPQNYVTEEYPDIFLGSEGKHTGTLFCGTDDIRIPVPTVETAFTLDIPEENIHQSGTLQTTLLFKNHLARDYFNAFPYNTFLNGDFGLLTIRNNRNNNGKHILLIKDSFSNCIAPYLAQVCGRLDLIDPRIYKDSIVKYISENRPDIVCITLSGREGNATFRFE